MEHTAPKRARNIPAAPAPRPEVLLTPQAYHGALDYVELERFGLRPEDVLDFSVNVNPYGPSPAVRAALAGIALDRYPDRESLALRRALAKHLGVAPSRIVAGNGTAELISSIALAFLRPGDAVLVVGPVFGEYSRAAALMGARVEWWTARPENGFAVEPDAVERSLRQCAPRLAFICNPNNPTGTLLPADAVDGWARAFPATLFVVDEAYLAFAAAVRSAVDGGRPNVLVLRSMTKDYALAGLRLGYAAGEGSVIDALARVRPPWNVNALAQAAGLAALSDPAHLAASLAALARDKERLMRGLAALGLPPRPSATHFFLVELAGMRAAEFRESLFCRGILVRDCASFGLPAHVRIATRREADNSRLLTAVRDVLAAGLSSAPRPSPETSCNE
jgi:L-threonine-O-3-phosphate decarboxylase